MLLRNTTSKYIISKDLLEVSYKIQVHNFFTIFTLFKKSNIS